MSFDEDWRLFAEALWDLQYVKKKSPLTKKLSEALHEISYGVTDIAAKGLYRAGEEFSVLGVRDGKKVQCLS